METILEAHAMEKVNEFQTRGGKIRITFNWLRKYLCKPRRVKRISKTWLNQCLILACFFELRLYSATAVVIWRNFHKYRKYLRGFPHDEYEKEIEEHRNTKILLLL